MTYKLIAIIVMGVLLAGCGGPRVASDAVTTLTTEEIKQDLLVNRRKFWKDPSSIRDARIGRAYSCPRHGDFTGEPTTCICIEANAKNAYGGFTGPEQNRVAYIGTTINHVYRADLDDQCEGLRPFPELNGDYAAPVAATPLGARSKKR